MNSHTNMKTVSFISWKEHKHLTIKEYLRDFLGGQVVKNLPSNAGDMGSIPGGKTSIPYATGHHNYRAHGHLPQLTRSPHATRKIPHTTAKT